GVGLPKTRTAVRAACQDGFAVRAKGDRTDRFGMLQGAKAVPGRYVPQAGGPVPASCQEHLAIRAEGHGKDTAIMLERRWEDCLSRSRHPDLDFSPRGGSAGLTAS